MKHDYLEQRFHPNLQIGFVPSVLNGRRLMPVHCHQGLWDSACGAHCAATAMALLGDIRNVATLSERRNGIAARLWKAARVKYFDGLTVDELASMIKDLRTEREITICTGQHTKCLAFVLAQFERGGIVILSWHSQRGQHHHWSTVVGLEGHHSGHKFLPYALLCLDPGVYEPILCGYNSRLEFNTHPVPDNQSYIRYRCADGSNMVVTLTSALAIGTTSTCNR